MTDNQSAIGEQDSTAPLTVVVSRRVRKGQQEAFEALSSQMTERASRFPGYLGTAMFRPASPDDPEYRIVFKFRDRETLTTWEESEERAELLEQIESLLVQPSEREVTSGIVTWFTLPGQNPVQPPPKWKMTIVSWLALYPAVTLVFVIFGDLLAQVPLLLRTMIVTIVVMGLMSYVLMPRMTKWFAFWLFPRQKGPSR
ncbi:MULTISPECIES: antibiotic biosynthesis monooxygenase [Marinobacter]|jgi:antibiotic biosynthesis monooxygenase (ABM) superfamily enzyme|uniref:Antibiotic biosynthesis monooxygenase n=1 Tax=Marinobacter salsuginis TaxID=418719 RepID=A0A5M3PUI8_9GAMM|nr:MULTISPECIES: antibiotic biosynthesis monooxygenase [Marinobacter]ODM33686.1 antibiotic biosynthesis monooxygenase [Marinobacter adhaerens]GBO86508.1 antibiotic biosynthesis monooxygenase [Marinobacter salsuginis]